MSTSGSAVTRSSHPGQGTHAEAETLFERSLSIWAKAVGPYHPSVGGGLDNLAGLYHRQGRYAETESIFEWALIILEKALGPRHPAVATTLRNYADLLSDTDRADEARKLEARAAAILARRAE